MTEKFYGDSNMRLVSTPNITKQAVFSFTFVNNFTLISLDPPFFRFFVSILFSIHGNFSQANFKSSLDIEFKKISVGVYYIRANRELQHDFMNMYTKKHAEMKNCSKYPHVTMNLHTRVFRVISPVNVTIEDNPNN
ncbi:hypothetical protein PHYBLDRAFT_166942 [Phycomyces blakesleeanus NRRL 1555(-)]|uniref:Uncharacterized protein n=1 Tax=Phycomyces blakesleeanus (strain ATCC 8743b / DSM 1359 / FGSC 10004 / NBRC 33097 / NRRL 1555) TaxID=763407 RepID=A0A167ND60_PHYB8|nr:hypothetical protein PHYBLDRAFT_166942 [Phycomyces blakesleeanus NRRL 1555(-)]OAD75714.1 hypothetical protein PHYBLDRAFT_166942 [Phycomyces blakesleeanus NRRL 1555(-)]|eukprot:XP_018293754.1 hypothetical protein PHYBLDRAFT_166942 [Phycomyces blakesleeanus NRRL 1555(-)]